MKAFGIASRGRLVALALPLALLGCGEGGHLGGTGGAGVPVAGRGGAGGSGGGAGGPAGPLCADRSATLRWRLTPDIAALSGVVVSKAPGPDGSEDVAIAGADGMEIGLNVRAPSPVPVGAGDRIDLRTAVRRSFRGDRTIEISRDGRPVLYLTEAEQPLLPPPVALERGDVACASRTHPADLTYHRLVAHDGDRTVVIDGGQQAKIGSYRVYNDLIQDFSDAVLDAEDMFFVAVIFEP